MSRLTLAHAWDTRARIAAARRRAALLAAHRGAPGGPGEPPPPGPGAAAVFDLAASGPTLPGFSAVEFNGVDQYLSAPDSPALRGGDADWAITLRFLLLSMPAPFAEYILVGKDDDAPNSRDYTIDVASGEDGLGVPITIVRFYVNGGGGGLIVIASTRPVAGRWYRLTCHHDAANDLIGIRLDDDEPDAAPTGGVAPHASSAEFRVGARRYAGFEGYAHARIRNVAIWKPPGGIAGKVGAIHEAGTGVPDHASLSPADRADLGLAAWWDLDEESGTRSDARGSADLTPAGGPIRHVSPPRDAWHRDPARTFGDWSLPAGAPPATYLHFGPALEHAPGRPGLRRDGVSWFPGTSWEAGVRAHVAILPGMAEIELCRTVGPDGRVARVTLDGQGRPQFRCADAGGVGEVVATCPTPLHGRCVVSGGAVTDAGVRAWPGPSDQWGGPRSMVRLDLDGLANLATGDWVTVSGCGVPFDGRHRVQVARDGSPPYILYAIDGADHLSATPAGGTATPTGEYTHPVFWVDSGSAPPGTPWIETPLVQAVHAPLRLRRQGDLVSFWVGGFPLGEASAPGLPPGPPAAGSTSWVGTGDPDAMAGPASLPARIEGFAAPLGAAEAWALDLRLDARVSGGRDHAGMAGSVEYEMPPGVLRRQWHLYSFLTVYVDTSTGGIVAGPRDEHTGDRHGVCKGLYAACPLGDHAQASASGFEAWTAVFDRRWDLGGAPRPPALLGMAKVADFARIPWGSHRYVDGAATAGDGSEGSPWGSFSAARPEVGPGVLVHVRGTLAGGVDASGLRGPFGLVGWGGRPVVGPYTGAFQSSCIFVADATHALFSGLELTHPGDASSVGFSRSTGITLRDVIGRKPAGGGPVTLTLGYETAHVAIHDYLGDGDTTDERYCIFFQAVARRLSLRRVRFLHGPGSGCHAMRMTSSDKVEMAGMRYPDAMTGDWGAGYSLRYAPRAATLCHSDIGNRSVVFGDNNDPPLNGFAAADPPGTGCVAEGVRCRSVIAEGIAGARVAACHGIMNQHEFTFSRDTPTSAPYPGVGEGNHAAAPGPAVSAAAGYPMAAAPSSGGRRNTSGGGGWTDGVPEPTGEALSAPAAVALAGPPGWLVAAADGLPQGGVGMRRLAGLIDGVPSGAGELIVAPLPAGPASAAFRAADEAAATADGVAAAAAVS